jgi:MFS family permease
MATIERHADVDWTGSVMEGHGEVKAGTGAFSVLLLRVTQRRFSATQYALFSSLFALPRLLAGPISGFLVDAIGWPSFFLASLTMGIPGMLMLARFAPPGVREPEFTTEEKRAFRPPLGAADLAVRGIAGGFVLGATGLLIVALLAALKTLRETKGAHIDLAGALARAIQPDGIGGWLQVVGILAFAVIGGLLVASFWIVQPFLPAIIWATTLVVATWPLMLRVQRYAGNSRGLAVLIMTLALLLVLIVPLVLLNDSVFLLVTVDLMLLFLPLKMILKEVYPVASSA